MASDQDLDFIVMELVDGQSLDHLIGRKGMKFPQAINCAVQIASGLAKAHNIGIIHRDLKPTNIIVTNDGLVKILDFGLAKLIEDVPLAGNGHTMTMGQAEKPNTEEGLILGTVAYMSPEQAEGKKIDARSDIFSFGTVLYEMLTGQKAFSRDSRIKTLAAILNENPKPASSFVSAKIRSGSGLEGRLGFRQAHRPRIHPTSREKTNRTARRIGNHHSRGRSRCL
ncbi:MAG: serine/threonine-protein kinase [Pseudomonadota bacterium]